MGRRTGVHCEDCFSTYFKTITYHKFVNICNDKLCCVFIGPSWEPHGKDIEPCFLWFSFWTVCQVCAGCTCINTQPKTARCNLNGCFFCWKDIILPTCKRNNLQGTNLSWWVGNWYCFVWTECPLSMNQPVLYFFFFKVYIGHIGKKGWIFEALDFDFFWPDGRKKFTLKKYSTPTKKWLIPYLKCNNC